MQNTMQTWARRGVLGTLFVLASSAALALPQAGSGGTPTKAATAQNKLPTYVRTTTTTAARNFQDRQGLKVMDLPKGTLLRVHERSLGKYAFYEVSVASGMQVWVFGQYLEPTNAHNVLRVTGNRVNQRPLPGLGGNGTPLSTSLMSSDRVEMIKRQDTTKPISEDWVQIWAPARTRAWVEVSDTSPVKDLAAATLEYQASKRKLPKASASSASASSKATPANAEKPKTTKAEVRPEATKSLRYADHLFAQAIADKNVTVAQLANVEQAYHRVLDMAPAGSTVRQLTIQQLEKLKMHQGLADLRVEMAQGQAAKEAELRRIEGEQRQADLRKTSSWGRFASRGWIESETIDGQVRYFVRWDGERKVEVACASGRYNMAMFLGYQVGLSGQTRRAATPMTLDAPAELSLIDVSRIEVIAGSASFR